MLVLTRREGSKVFIGKNKEIVVTLVWSGNGRCQIGFEAPKDIPISREELLAGLKRDDADPDAEDEFSGGILNI